MFNECEIWKWYHMMVVKIVASKQQDFAAPPSKEEWGGDQQVGCDWSSLFEFKIDGTLSCKLDWYYITSFRVQRQIMRPWSMSLVVAQVSYLFIIFSKIFSCLWSQLFQRLLPCQPTK